MRHLLLELIKNENGIKTYSLKEIEGEGRYHTIGYISIPINKDNDTPAYVSDNGDIYRIAETISKEYAQKGEQCFVEIEIL